MLRQIVRSALATAFLACAALPASAQVFLGPTPYFSAADSPFPLGSGAFALETFEDHLLNTPGVSSPTGLVTSTMFSGTIIDSVDADDGVFADNACAGCDGYFGGGGAILEFHFDASLLGGLPTKAGLVWTDGGPSTVVVFEAFDGNGFSLGTISAANQGDPTYYGTAVDDVFYGVEYSGGISEIRISHAYGGIEIDHLQYELPCAAAAATSYCTSKTNSKGCAPKIGFDGCPSATSPTPCKITGAQFLNKKSGLLFYGHQANGAAFQGGHLCVKVPLVRAGVQNSGGSPTGSDCTGTYAYDLNARIQSGIDPTLVAGATLYMQWWSRDPNDAFLTSLSNGLSLTIGP
ncbi:MAG: hypothetical protein K8S98_00180 [Planctomycetes bacterium]|nr:hypothetical protein [Planctomycetota bacterium]